MSDPDQGFVPNADGEEYTPLKPRPRKPERVGKPRAAREDDLAAAVARITDGIVEKHRRMYGKRPSR